MPRPIFQFPNRPLLTTALAAAAARFTNGRYATAAHLVSHLALFVWGVEEVTTGANWFRRSIGVVGGGLALSRLLRPPSGRDAPASGP